jgi:hypothetical protein
MMADAEPGAPTGPVRTILRLEGLALLVLATGAYFLLGGNLWLFVLLFFAPDLSFAAYTAGPRIGALVYNAVHTTILPAAIGAVGWLTDVSLLWQIALVLAAHIGFDRTLGYGLKYASAFGDTHLGRVGRK